MWNKVKANHSTNLLPILFIHVPTLLCRVQLLEEGYGGGVRFQISVFLCVQRGDRGLHTTIHMQQRRPLRSSLRREWLTVGTNLELLSSVVIVSLLTTESITLWYCCPWNKCSMSSCKFLLFWLIFTQCCWDAVCLTVFSFHENHKTSIWNGLIN